MPYHTRADRINGAVITFTDINTAKTILEQRLAEQTQDLRKAQTPRQGKVSEFKDARHDCT